VLEPDGLQGLERETGPLLRRPAAQGQAQLDVLLTPEERHQVRLLAHDSDRRRAEAGARKDQPDWPLWAQLQNASRSLVLQASTCRDLAARLAGRRR